MSGRTYRNAIGDDRRELACWSRSRLVWDHEGREGSRVKPSVALDQHREAVRSVVLSHRATNPRVFGSAARGEDSASSDLDLLVDPTAETTLFDIGAIRHELLGLLGVPVDVVTPNALPPSFRETVLAEAVPV